MWWSVNTGAQKTLRSGHWRLDVVMNEDQDRTRALNGAHNLAVLRYMAISAAQKESSKGAMRGKFKRAGCDDRFLFRLFEMS